ncbi:hypothetical protein [Pseudomonas sp. Irchel 3H9]|uniref:hypothetical protein n=1 Tax=Pseudomonas sp. Irchel 3H9 TaxID=2009043 RepID=UPI00117B05AF|nr:hypothetical protein [Pseudomonas sp. Irchel 3H9]
MLSAIKIALLDETQRIWFVRSSSGRYAPHFKSGKLIATDYLSEVFNESELDVMPTKESIKSALLTNDKFSEFRVNTKDKKETKSLNLSGAKLQAAITKFKEDIGIGDLIITKTASGGFMFGICNSDEAYFSKEPVTLASAEVEGASAQDKIKLKYTLRKNVTWGPTIRESEIPDALKNSLARNTLTEITQYKEMVYHLLYPFYTDGQNLYFSNKIRSTRDINSAVVGKLFQNISLVNPLVSALLNDIDIDPEQLLREVDFSIFSNVVLSTSKADFMSPGDTWSKIPLIGNFNSKTLTTAVLSCLLVTGIVGIHEIESALANSSVQNQVDSSGISPSSTKPSEEIENTLFNDKFRDEQTSTPELDKIRESLLRQKNAINQLSERTYAKAINDSLQLELLQPNTSNLENIEFGIKLQKLGSN